MKTVDVADYLAGELVSPVKHEYIGGLVYAMAGASNVHNQIASNVLGSLWASLRGKPCRPFNSDVKVRVQLPRHLRFYYPDASVACRSGPPNQSFQDEPVILVEVLSPHTRRIDECEKKEAYLGIPSLAVYLLIEQDEPAVVAHRRTGDGFVEEVHRELDAVISLKEIGAELPLAEVYEAVEFTPGTDAAGADDESGAN